MVDLPLVSIIMPAYNAESTIVESINSVIDQTYTNWELIIVNDGSTDQTGFLIQQFLPNQKIVYIEQANRGVSCARNTAIKNAKGDFVAFLDSDDLWIKNKLEVQVRFFNENKHISLVYSNVKRFISDISNSFISKEEKRFHISSLKEWLVVCDYIPTVTVMVRTSVLNDIGSFDENLSGPEDWDMWIRISQKYQIAEIPVITAYYRENPNGISKRQQKQLIEESKVRYKHLRGSYSYPKKIRRISFWLDYRNKTKYAMKTKNYYNGFKYYLYSVFYDPFNVRNFYADDFNIYSLIRKVTAKCKDI